MNGLKLWISKLSIQQKLIYSNLIGIAFAFIPVVVIMVTYEYISLRDAILKELRVQSDIIAESTSAAVAFQDHESAHETLFALHGSHDFLEAHLILPNGAVFESYYKEGHIPLTRQTSIDLSKLHAEQVKTSMIIIHKPIRLRTEEVGSLVMISSLDTFYNRLMWYVLFITMTSTVGFILARLVATRISKTITGPLSTLTAVTQRIMRDRDYSIPLSIDTKDEVGSLSNAFGEMMSQIRKRDLSLQQLAYYDRITDIPNRHYFEERIAQAVTNAERYGTTCYLLMIDLDDFKIVNDTLGHHIGDELLRYVSETLKNTMRQNDTIFRIGGDEFAVIIESASDNESVSKIAQKIIDAVSTPVILEGHTVHVGASIGISYYPKHSSSVRSLMSTADVAMYIAKGKGKNGFEVYDPKFSAI